MEYNIDDNTNFETETDVDFSTSEYMENNKQYNINKTH